MKVLSKKQLLNIKSEDPVVIKIQHEVYIKKVSEKINEFVQGKHKDRIKKFLNENHYKK